MFSNITDVWGDQNSMKEITNRLSRNDFRKYNEPKKPKSSDNSVDLLSGNSDFISLSPVNFKSISPDSEDQRCTKHFKHINKCGKCHNRLRKLINSRVDQKMDEIILQNKMKQLNTPTSIIPKSWSDYGGIIGIMIGAIIILFLILMMIKTLR